MVILVSKWTLQTLKQHYFMLRFAFWPPKSSDNINLNLLWSLPTPEKCIWLLSCFMIHYLHLLVANFVSLFKLFKVKPKHYAERHSNTQFSWGELQMLVILFCGFARSNSFHITHTYQSWQSNATWVIGTLYTSPHMALVENCIQHTELANAY